MCMYSAVFKYHQQFDLHISRVFLTHFYHYKFEFLWFRQGLPDNHTTTLSYLRGVRSPELAVFSIDESWSEHLLN